jgi:cobalamin-dependent methionine synthase I
LENILNETSFSNIRQTQTSKSIEWLKQSIKQTLSDQFLQDWNSSVHNSPKAFNYRIFKTDFKLEEYFNILDEQNSLLLCKFRTTNHKLSIEKGRWSNILRKNRYYELCQKNQIGDEYHYIFECTNLSEKRTSLLPKHLIERPNIIKF